MEREELRVELALSEKARRRKLEELHHAALDVHGGIDAFEINMKRLVRGDQGQEGEEVVAPPAGRTPLEHMEQLKSRAAATAKLLEDTAAYMRGVKDARADEVASKREREVGPVIWTFWVQGLELMCLPSLPWPGHVGSMGYELTRRDIFACDFRPGGARWLWSSRPPPRPPSARHRWSPC